MGRKPTTPLGSNELGDVAQQAEGESRDLDPAKTRTCIPALIVLQRQIPLRKAQKKKKLVTPSQAQQTYAMVACLVVGYDQKLKSVPRKREVGVTGNVFIYIYAVPPKTHSLSS